jgi:hypothetical protein
MRFPLLRALAASVLASIPGASPAQADYSPLQVGRTWIYEGKGVHEVDGVFAPNGSLKVVQYREVLRLEVTRVRTENGTTRYTLEERDSLSGRMEAYWNLSSSGSEIGPLPDTLITRTLTYVQDTAIRLEHGDSLGLGHHAEPDPFFPAVSGAPRGGTEIQGLRVPYRGVQAYLFFPQSPGREARGTAWYLDGIGMYWMRLDLDRYTCSGAEKRELLLRSFDGTPVDPGVAPPGTPLAKESKIACGIRRVEARLGRGAVFARGPGGREEEADARGRRTSFPALRSAP